MFSKGLLALACGTFALGVAEFSMMGILSFLARDMGVSIPRAGDFISVYAIGVSLGAVLPIFFRKHPLKYILLGLSLLIVAGNVLAACAGSYYGLLAARFISGLPHGAYFGVGAIVAVSLVPPGRKATAVAIMITGMTVANVAGVPFATWITHIWTWRVVFLITALWAAIAFAGIFLTIPKVQPLPGRGLKKEFRFLRGPAPWLIFLATFLGQGSIYCWYSYMEPMALQITQIPADDMKWVMVLAGFGMFTGGLASGRLADRFRPSLVCAITALLMIPTLMVIYFFGSNVLIALPMIFLATAELFGLGGPMQYLIVRFSRGGEILGGAGIQIAFNMSNAFAAFVGGVAIRAGWGIGSPALLGLPMAAICVAVLFWFYFRYKNVGA